MSKKSTLEPKSGPVVTETTPLVSKNQGLEGGNPGYQPIKNEGGLSVQQTSALIAGEMAGSGLLALPRALTKTGWLGVPIILLLGVVAAFNGKRLADCWSIIEERDPQMRTRQRNPYAIIADRALGKTWSVIVSVAIMVTLFGASVVYLLMAAQIIEQILLSLVPNVTYCIWFLVVSCAMTPLMLFGTPRDFSLTGVVAFGTTILACMFYFIQMMNDIKPFVFRWGIHGFEDFFLAFGTIMFAFGGASAFPTIQNDMADKTKFGESVQSSFAALLCLYLPFAITGYAVYGERVAPNVALSLTATPLTLVGNILMAVHLISAFIIIINPVCQEIEELYNVPRDSVGWRTLSRGLVMLTIIFVGETIPRFQNILSLVGASSIALLTFILPSLCYLKLTDQSPPEGQTAVARPNWIKTVCWEVIALGTVAGIAATFSAFSSIFSTAQVTPCYLR